MVCDNQSMVNKTNEISKYVTMYPNSTMVSEYDVLAEIQTAMRKLGMCCPELDHIKGHWSDNIREEENINVHAAIITASNGSWPEVAIAENHFHYVCVMYLL